MTPFTYELKDNTWSSEVTYGELNEDVTHLTSVSCGGEADAKVTTV